MNILYLNKNFKWNKHIKSIKIDDRIITVIYNKFNKRDFEIVMDRYSMDILKSEMNVSNTLLSNIKKIIDELSNVIFKYKIDYITQDNSLKYNYIKINNGDNVECYKSNGLKNFTIITKCRIPDIIKHI